MSALSISDRVRKLIAEDMYIALEKVTPGASFMDDLGTDSLDHVELIMSAEEEFDISIPDDVAENWTTVQHAIDGITGLVAG